MARDGVTEEEYEARLKTALEMIPQGYKMFEVKRALQDKFGMTSQSAQRVYKEAWAEIRKDLNLPDDYHRGRISNAMYNVLRNGVHRDQVNASKALCRLLGINKQVLIQEVEQTIKIDLPDWRAPLKDSQANGKLKSASDESEPDTSKDSEDSPD